MGKHVLTVVVALVIGLSLVLYMFAYQVRSSEVAIVLTFGKPSPESPAPGYHFKWPWPIQEVRRFDNRVHVQEGRFEETLTRDQYNVIVSLVVGWTISDVQQFNTNFGRFEKPIEQAWANHLERIVRNHTLAVIGTTELRQLVSADPVQLKFNEIEAEILQKAQDEAGNRYGARLTLAKIRRLELPESATQKVYSRMKAERGGQAQKIQSAATEAAEVIRGEADSQREQILALANSEAERIRGEGDAEAARYYSVFVQNPDLAIYLRKIRALRETTLTNTTVILDTTTPPFDLLVTGPPMPKQVEAPKEASGSADTTTP
jgi:membrane protease subunit HflC